MRAIILIRKYVCSNPFAGFSLADLSGTSNPNANYIILFLALFQDLQIIYYGLLGLEALRPCRDSVLRGLCKIVRYERHHANHVLY